jgi:hypothetical protein
MVKKLIVACVFIVLLVVVVSCTDAVAFNPTGDRLTDVQTYLQSYIISEGYINPVVTVTYMGGGSYEAYLQYDDPEGTFTQQFFRVTVNYDGTGTPELYGGFE